MYLQHVVRPWALYVLCLVGSTCLQGMEQERDESEGGSDMIPFEVTEESCNDQLLSGIGSGNAALVAQALRCGASLEVSNADTGLSALALAVKQVGAASQTAAQDFADHYLVLLLLLDTVIVGQITISDTVLNEAFEQALKAPYNTQLLTMAFQQVFGKKEEAVIPPVLNEAIDSQETSSAQTEGSVIEQPTPEVIEIAPESTEKIFSYFDFWPVGVGLSSPRDRALWVVFFLFVFLYGKQLYSSL
jgi:hypothetical protein